MTNRYAANLVGWIGRIAPSVLSQFHFVCRVADLATLEELLNRAGSGQSRIVAIRGEPGIGKTALCTEFAARAVTAGATTLTGNCYTEGTLSVPYLPIIEVIQGWIDQSERRVVRSLARTVLADLGGIVPHLLTELGLPTPPATSSEEAKHRLLNGTARFFQTISDKHTTLVVLEDLHDADRGTLDLLSYLSRNLAGARLLCVATYRDLDMHRGHPLSEALGELIRAPTFAQTSLSGMNAAEVDELMVMTAGQPIPPVVVQAAVRSTEGNPLFVQQLTQLLADGDLLHAKQRAVEIAERALPVHLRALIDEQARPAHRRQQAAARPGCRHRRRLSDRRSEQHISRHHGANVRRAPAGHRRGGDRRGLRHWSRGDLPVLPRSVAPVAVRCH